MHLHTLHSAHRPDAPHLMRVFVEVVQLKLAVGVLGSRTQGQQGRGHIAWAGKDRCTRHRAVFELEQDLGHHGQGKHAACGQVACSRQHQRRMHSPAAVSAMQQRNHCPAAHPPPDTSSGPACRRWCAGRSRRWGTGSAERIVIIRVIAESITPAGLGNRRTESCGFWGAVDRTHRRAGCCKLAGRQRGGSAPPLCN